MKDLKKELGCNLVKEKDEDKCNFLYEKIALGGEKPEEFIVESPHFYQNGIDACVGMAGAGAKSVQESKELSPRVAWSLCKKEQGYKGWGTYVSILLKVMQNIGIPDYGIVDENPKMDRTKYMKIAEYLTDDILNNAFRNRIESYWMVGANNWELAYDAVCNEEIPLITSMPWHKEYNSPKNGFIPHPKSKNSVGHCFVFNGIKLEPLSGRRVLVFRNSGPKSWGDDNYFYIYEDEAKLYDIRTLFVIKDIPKDLAKLINEYSGKLVKTEKSEKVYFIDKENKRHIENELAFWLFTEKDLSKDIVTIPLMDLKMFDKGNDIKVNDFDPNLLRVIKKMGTLYNNNPEYALELFKL